MSATTTSGLLLRLRNRNDHQAWDAWVTLYSPLIRQWLTQAALCSADADDLLQEVLQTVVKEMPNFRYDRAKGSFRGWLRTILVNRLRHFQRNHRRIGQNERCQEVIENLADAASGLSAQWDREHDQYVLRHLLRVVETEFAVNTWQSFVAVALQGEPPAQVAQRLGQTLNAVRIAKSRVLQRLQQYAAQFDLESSRIPRNSENEKKI
jgi:RNA polymerase sigma factor (sigma-70 family)